ncbi:MAG TPA: DNA polymerase I [Methylomusa anaerophila]|uniref:DNA polymerase I n=1 Tax=Methylomusa anaerophila TaxID=1930071 RepID=A0A348AQP3_9FIRM|nr:DNA polymerase I [Methylomusa anaerophila]BBB93391.1 DNA polymerase I [Methylomusa anaerophila]HML90339.1 DNA polymerase I [Methylomusa anaerophila]
MSQKFIIIDGSSLVHRAFHALPMLRTATGIYTNAVYGFTTMLVKLLAEYRPDYLVVAFDKGRITFRNESYDRYKANRQATPPELAEQFPLVRELCQAFGIATMEEAGYEADDIIGTLAAKAEDEGLDVFIVTGDRDALQLIQPNIKVLLTKKGISDLDVFDTAALKDKYGLSPEQLIDLKGLMGDKSDNIPGVPGIGEKTACKLLNEFGSLEKILENIDNVAGKRVQEALRCNVDQAILSKKLATIVRDMPLEFTVGNYKITPDSKMLRDLFLKFEFKSLLAKIDTILPGAAGADRRNADPVAEEVCELPQVERVNNSETAKEIIALAKKAGYLACYALTTGHLPSTKLEGLSVTILNKTVYFSARCDGWENLTGLLADNSILKYTHDAKKLLNACYANGFDIRGIAFDSVLAAYLLDPTAATYPLAELAEKYMVSQCRYNISREETPEYAGWASKIIDHFKSALESKLSQTGLLKLYLDIELPLVEVLSSMELSGIKVDRGYLMRMAEEINIKIENLLGEIYRLAEAEFNVNSTKQLGVILFEKIKLPVIKKTKTGYSTDAEVLEKLAGQHPLVDKLLEYRTLTKLKSTYLDGMLPLIDQQTGRIHTSFNQTVTATGRLSSSEPNLQNIPIRTEIGRKIRELFVPGEGYSYLMSADYSQIELRILAHMAGDDSLVEAFRNNQDIHTRTAAEVFGVNMSDVTPEMRARAKAVNFGIVYGISDYGLARDIGVSRKEAGFYIDSYFNRYRGVKNYIEALVANARQNGYVTTMFGRRRYLPDINSSNFNQRSFAERTAMNTPIQGTAADIIKIAMIKVYCALKEEGLRSRLLLQVHDELVIEVAEAELAKVQSIVKHAMEQAGKLIVPLVADIKIGKNWAQAK